MTRKLQTASDRDGGCSLTHGLMREETVKQQQLLARLRKLIVISLSVVLVACPPAVIGENYPSSQVPGSRSVRFMANQTAKLIHSLQLCEPSSLANITDAWTPTAREVRVLDHSVRTELRDTLRGRSFNEADYFVQYFGVVDSGRRKIFVNGFHEIVNRTATSDTTAWRRGSVLVCDSGLGAFQADYDVEAKQLSRIRFFSSLGGRVTTKM